MTELVVLVDDAGRALGTADKATVHTENTPLHQAFSAYLLDAAGQVLLTRRALGKKTWPGVWTNSFCGHPGPGEALEDAIVRRALDELGIEASSLADPVCILPDYRYRAVDSSGIVENELCPVFTVQLAAGIGFEEALDPRRAEVDSWFTLPADRLIAAVDAAPGAFSPWLVGELADERLRSALLSSGR
ncbi:isopentenyl-diphosphate Delta-isomerase [Corynebacterium uterequi]|uniref:Isopentenyl-diphosphate Delta-isomerase n=1 Tax=Corynebacterium uterequi TaxID=1072256 RepID=A0A0G3HE50_9CORY|nr:isopentenyl-diphosphate Delta-isomerase [Corynebacterium uterequi]AKK11594.1 isopentenyl-diphosphate delta-isomerase [Corynebacterium uterequi]